MKQYILMCNEIGMQKIRQVSNDTIEFLEVQGIVLNDNQSYHLIATPAPQTNIEAVNG